MGIMSPYSFQEVVSKFRKILLQLDPVCVDVSMFGIVESERTARVEVDQRGCTARVVFRYRTHLLTSDRMADQYGVSDV